MAKQTINYTKEQIEAAVGRAKDLAANESTTASTPDLTSIRVNDVLYKVPQGGGGGAVTSVNGQTGDVTVQATLNAGPHITISGSGESQTISAEAGLPTTAVTSNAMVYDGTNWSAQEGYGYFIDGDGQEVIWDGIIGERESFTVYFEQAGINIDFARIVNQPKTSTQLDGGTSIFLMEGNTTIPFTLNNSTYLSNTDLQTMMSGITIPSDAFGYSEDMGKQDLGIPEIIVFPTDCTIGESNVPSGIYAFSIFSGMYRISYLSFGTLPYTRQIDHKFTFGTQLAGQAYVGNGTEWAKHDGYGYGINIPQQDLFDVQWDGDTTGLTKVLAFGQYGDDDAFYKVSNRIDITPEDLSKYRMKESDDPKFYELDMDKYSDDFYYHYNSWAIVYKDNTTVNIGSTSRTFAEKGLYFFKGYYNRSQIWYLESISIEAHVNYTKFNESYIPVVQSQEVKSASDTNGFGYVRPAESMSLTWDGDTTGKESIMAYYFKMSGDSPYSINNVIGGTTTNIYQGQQTTNTITSEDIQTMGDDLYGLPGDVIIALKDTELDYAQFKSLTKLKLPIIDKLYSSSKVNGIKFSKGVWFAKEEDQTYTNGFQYSVSQGVSRISSDYVDTVSVSATGTATDEVKYITVNGTENKIYGGRTFKVTYGEEVSLLDLNRHYWAGDTIFCIRGSVILNLTTYPETTTPCTFSMIETSIIDNKVYLYEAAVDTDGKTWTWKYTALN